MSVEVESSLQTVRDLLMTTFRGYKDEKCSKEGDQLTNLTKDQEKGMKSLKKRVKDGEIIIVPTDKSGNLAIMSRSTYLEAGLGHAKNDKEVTWREVKESQHDLNGHVSMLIKCFRIGAYWDHGWRVRETMMGNNQALCPLSLLYKDHKGWSPGLLLEDTWASTSTYLRSCLTYWTQW